MANKKISELEPGQQVVSDTQLPGSLGAQTFKYTADQLAAYVQSKDTAGDIDGPLTGVEVVGIRGRSVSATEPTNGQILQWNGTAWVPVAVPASGFDPVIHEYTSPVTDELLTIPTGCKVIDIICIGAGGGGGSGRRGAAGSIRCGGGGGAGGGLSFATIKAADVTGPLKITVGTGGTGATAQTFDSNNGNTGGNGGPSFVTTNTSALLCRGGFGSGGLGGTATNGGGGTTAGSDFAGGSGNPASTSGGAGQDTGQAVTRGASGGGAGGGISSGNSAADGSSGSAVLYGQVSVVNRGTVASPNGTGGYSPLQGQSNGGGGGGGGASSLTAAGGTGGNGTRGGGGGGGGASVNGNNSGAGGNGGNGYVRIIFS